MAKVAALTANDVDAQMAQNRTWFHEQVRAAARVTGALKKEGKTLSQLSNEATKSNDPKKQHIVRTLTGGTNTQTINVRFDRKGNISISNTLADGTKDLPKVIDKTAGVEKKQGSRLKKIIKPEATTLNLGSQYVTAVFQATNEKKLQSAQTALTKSISSIANAASNAQHPLDVKPILEEAAELEGLAEVTGARNKVAKELEKVRKIVAEWKLTEEYNKKVEEVQNEAKAGEQEASAAPGGSAPAGRRHDNLPPEGLPGTSRAAA